MESTKSLKEINIYCNRPVYDMNVAVNGSEQLDGLDTLVHLTGTSSGHAYRSTELVRILRMVTSYHIYSEVKPSGLILVTYE